MVNIETMNKFQRLDNVIAASLAMTLNDFDISMLKIFRSFVFNEYLRFLKKSYE